MVQQTLRVVEPQQERPHHARAGGIAEPAHHAIHRPGALDLLHPGAVAGAIVEIEALGDHAVHRAARAGEPRAGQRGVGGGGRQRESGRVRQVLPSEGLEPPAALAQRPVGEPAALGVHQEIEDDQHRGRLAREPLHAARRRMDALKQVVEGEAGPLRHHQLAVEDEAAGLECAERRHHLGEIPRQRLARLRLELHPISVPEGHTAEAVPLGLVLPGRPKRELRHQARFHGRIRRRQRQRHASARGRIIRRSSVDAGRAGRAPARTDRPRERAGRARCRGGNLPAWPRARLPARSAAWTPRPGATAAPSRPRPACGPTRSGCSRRGRARRAGGPRDTPR